MARVWPQPGAPSEPGPGTGPAMARRAGWQAGPVRRLVALDLAGGPAFVAALRRAWDEGDAVLPVDQRLPAAGRADLLARVRPHEVVGPHGERRELHRDAPPVADGDALVVTTSGSTGAPKAVLHTHDGLRAHAEAVQAHLGVDPDRDRWLACLPLAHLGGLGVVLRAVLTGTPVDVLPGFDAAAVAAAPTERGTTLVSLVPTALDRLAGPDVAALRWVVLGGSGDATPRPANVVHTYGLTETGGGVVYGGVPLPGVEVRVGPDGAIALRGPMLARGRRRPDGTVAPIVDADGWLATGDLGRWGREPVDASSPTDGAQPLLWVEGRADDLIVTGGENVWPGPVEAVLGGHPAVAEVAVVGRPDPTWGQAVTAVVVASDPARPPVLDELRDHVRAVLPAHAAPRRLELVARLPRTALGKVRRAALDG